MWGGAPDSGGRTPRDVCAGEGSQRYPRRPDEAADVQDKLGPAAINSDFVTCFLYITIGKSQRFTSKAIENLAGRPS